jgi:signal transduction histidine kinase
VELKLRDGAVALRVADNGTGLDAGSSDGRPGGLSGNGLRNMQKRAESVGGRLTVESVNGKGLRVYAIIPLEPPANTH